MNTVSTKKYIIITLIVVLIIATPIIFFISKYLIEQNLLNGTNIKISNFNQQISKDLTFDRQLAFYQHLHETLINKNNLPEDTTISDIIIREGSLSKISYDNDSITYNFIIDIDSLKQSYQIENFSLSKTEPSLNSATINCPPINDSKYPTSFCEGMYNNTVTATINPYLPSYRSINLTYPYTINYSPTIQNTLLLTTTTCDNQVPEKAISDTTTWLKSLGLEQFLDKIDLESICTN